MRHPSAIAAFRLAAAALVTAGCAADSLTLPRDGEPAAVVIVHGNGQQGMAGNPLGDSLVISVTDGQDRPVINRSVAFVVPSGGTVVPATLHTNGEGKAVFRWVLGPAAGEQTLEVGPDADGPLSPKATFRATATPGPVHAISLISGDGQTAAAGTPLPQPLVVRVLDSFGNGVAGETVTWQTSSGGLQPSTAVTGDDGSTTAVWTLGQGVGVQTATARFSGASGSPVSFSANATQGASPRLSIVTQPSATAQGGVAFSRQPAVRLETAQGAPIQQAGVSVTAAIAIGGGTLGGTTTVQTNGSGIAQFSGLAISGSPGDRTLIFAAVNHTAATSATIAVTGPVVSPSRSTVTAAPASIQAGGEQSVITVTARDASGNPLSGLQVVITVSGSGNTVTQPGGMTNTNGVATGTLTSSVTGTKTVSATIAGTAVTQTATVTVQATGPSAQQSTANVPGGKRFQWTTLTITTRDAAGNKLTRGGYANQIRVSVSGANTASNLSIFDQGDGTYQASYFPVFKGSDDITITINGTAIQGSPYRSQVK